MDTLIIATTKDILNSRPPWAVLTTSDLAQLVKARLTKQKVTVSLAQIGEVLRLGRQWDFDGFCTRSYPTWWQGQRCMSVTQWSRPAEIGSPELLLGFGS